MSPYAAACCRVLQRVAACCSVFARSLFAHLCLYSRSFFPFLNMSVCFLVSSRTYPCLCEVSFPRPPFLVSGLVQNLGIWAKRPRKNTDFLAKTRICSRRDSFRMCPSLFSIVGGSSMSLFECARLFLTMSVAHLCLFSNVPVSF